MLNLEKFYKDKDILVTGGCGSIGSEIVNQLLKYNPKRIRVFDNNESGHFYLNQKFSSDKIRNLLGDIRDLVRLNRAMQGVDMVFHAAALKHVPFCEYNPFEAVNTNVIGTRNVVDAAISNDVAFFVAISTDKAVNPINTMGASKLLSEKIVINGPVGTHKIKLGAIRFGNVLDSVGSVIPIFKEQIKKGGPVTITSNRMTRFFMTIPESVSLILKSPLKMNTGREVFVLKMKALKIIDLAEIMIEELAPKYGFEFDQIKLETIGVRPGEKLHESLFTQEESAYIHETEDVFILKNSILDKPNVEKYKDYSYDSSQRLLSKEELRKLLKTQGIV
jgi:FlaA1/EpsC-like NDP-sugar epimerase